MCFPEIAAPSGLSYFTAVTSIFIAIIATAGNGLIIFLVIKDPLKKLQSPFHYFLVNLAVSDLIVGLFMMPFSIVAHFQEARHGSVEPILVKLLHMSYFISATASLLSLLVLSIDRYIAIAKAIKYRQYLSWDRCKIVSLFIWVISLSIPFVYLKIGYINYLMFCASGAILMGLMVMAMTYVKIYEFIRMQNSNMKRTVKRDTETGKDYEMIRLKMEKVVTKTFFIIITVFVCTYIPALIMIFVLHFCEDCPCTLRHSLRDLQFILISANSCVNPFICTIRLKPYIQSIHKLFGKKSNNTNSSTTSNKTSKVTENSEGLTVL